MTELDVCSLEVFEEVGLLLPFCVSSIISVFIICCFFGGVTLVFYQCLHCRVTGMYTCTYLYSFTVFIKS